MKKIYIIPIMLLMLLFGSCKKYLDIKSNGQSRYVETATDCQLLLDNYNTMNTNYPFDGEASSDDYYFTENDFPGDYNQEDKDIYTWQPTALRGSNPQWVRTYNVAYNANLVLETIDRLSGKEDAAVLGNLKGSALFFRAYAFWNIAQLYTNAFGETAGQDPGIPIRLSADLNEKLSRGTVAQTYDRIVQDLNDALQLLNTPTVSSIVTRPNKASVYAMLARVYLSKGDYTAALSSSSAALALMNQRYNNDPLIDYSTLSNSDAPFVRFNKEVIFHSVMANSAILNPSKYKVNLDIVNAYRTNDLRKDVLLEPNGDGTYRFTGNYESDFSPILFNGLATDELYLTRAECYARAGNTNDALTDLNTLLAKRWNTNGGTTPYQAITATSSNEALGIILSERRKELLMRGLRWSDLRRLNKENQFKVTLTRTVKIGDVVTTYTLPPNDPRYTLLIPADVIQKGGYSQNKR